jgi:hypothetical protein
MGGAGSLEAGWETNFGELEKVLVKRALLQADGNKSRAAELLGIHRPLLYPSGRIDCRAKDLRGYRPAWREERHHRAVVDRRSRFLESTTLF